MPELPAFSFATFGAGIAGLLLGGFFFGTLWWSVRLTLRAEASAMRQIWLLLLRFGVVLAGFYAIGAGHWERMAAGLAGFLVARLLAGFVTRAWERRQASAPSSPTTREAGHAPQR